MDSLLILIPVALMFVAIAVKAFLWAVDNRQYDDLDAAAESILFDDAEVSINSQQQSVECSINGVDGAREKSAVTDADD